MNDKIKNELLVSFQFAAVLLLTIMTTFVVWMWESIGNSSSLNIGEAWRSMSPFYLKLIFWFSLFSLIRLIIISFSSSRR
jgi:hypothetical protein